MIIRDGQQDHFNAHFNRKVIASEILGRRPSAGRVELIVTEPCHQFFRMAFPQHPTSSMELPPQRHNCRRLYPNAQRLDGTELDSDGSGEINGDSIPFVE